MYINNKTASNIGLFGYLDGTTIRNLSFNRANLHGKDYVGTLSGRVDNSIVSQVTVDSLVSGHYYYKSSSDGYKGGSHIGGLVGYAKDVDLINSYTLGSVVGRCNVGAIYGQVSGGEITNSYSVAHTSGDSGYNVDCDSRVNSNWRHNYDYKNIGGLRGSGSVSITNSYHNHIDLKTGTGTTAIFTKWDTDIWDFGTANELSLIHISEPTRPY